MFLRTFVVSLVCAVPLLALADVTSGCTGGECACSDGGVDVFFPTGVTSDEIQSITGTSNICGPVPMALCDSNKMDCSTKSQLSGWFLNLPSSATGTCKVHVVLKNGKTLDGTSTVGLSTGCCAGYGGPPLNLK